MLFLEPPSCFVLVLEKESALLLSLGKSALRQSGRAFPDLE